MSTQRRRRRLRRIAGGPERHFQRGVELEDTAHLGYAGDEAEVEAPNEEDGQCHRNLERGGRRRGIVVERTQDGVGRELRSGLNDDEHSGAEGEASPPGRDQVRFHNVVD